jgi:hypothetical protein
MGDVINLTDFKRMQQALDESDIRAGNPDAKIIAYRDINGIPQIAVEGETITAEQLQLMPEDIRDLLIIETGD